MAYSIAHHRRMKEKPVSTFGKKPFKGKSKNRKGRLNKSATNRNPLDLHDFYIHMVKIASLTGCDAHHWMPKSKLKQDIFLTLVSYDKHREIHSSSDGLNPTQWALERGFDVLVDESMTYFEEWANDNNLSDEYFDLINDLRDNPLDAHNIAKDFIFNNRNL